MSKRIDRLRVYAREDVNIGVSSQRVGGQMERGVRFVFRSMLQLTTEKIEREQKRNAHSQTGRSDRFIAASTGAAFSFSSLFPPVPRV